MSRKHEKDVIYILIMKIKKTNKNTNAVVMTETNRRCGKGGGGEMVINFILRAGLVSDVTIYTNKCDRRRLQVSLR